jgi:hypothetical protein
MKFLLMTTPDPNAPPRIPNPDEYAEMGKLIEDGFRDGTLVATGTMDPKVTKITSAAGNISLTDGPFTEAKEAIVGYALVNVDSKEQAIELSKRFWKIVGDGSGVIQRLYDPNEDWGS